MCRRTVGDRHRDVFVYESAVNDRRCMHICIQPLRAYRRALLAPPSTSDGLHRQTRELNIDRLDTRVSQMLVFPQREAFLEIPTRFGKTASRRRVTYFPGATSLGDPNYHKRILLDYIYDSTPRTLRL